jgi:23S rRNA (uracil1939-C5)-methyltransferase
VDYAAQVQAKEAALRALLAEHWTGEVPVTPSPAVWHYRNKVDPAFARMRYAEKPPPGFVKETVLGFKRRGQWYWPLELETCLIGPEGLADLFSAVREWHRGAGLRALDERSGDGVLRHLIVRDAKRTGQRMVVLITAPGAPDLADFVRVVRGAYGAHSIWHGISTGSREVAQAEEMRLLDGTPAIDEVLHLPDGRGTRELRFQISPFSFFQTNPRATENLYACIREWVRAVAPRHLYDLYGGMGSIAFTCADLVEHVDSVESVQSASEDGRANAPRNGIDNVTFHTDVVEKYLTRLRDQGGLAADSAVVIDPARAGLHPKALKRLGELAPEHLLYVSCNPKLFARELPALLETHQLAWVRGFDLFPHTPHVELVAALVRH